MVLRIKRPAQLVRVSAMARMAARLLMVAAVMCSILCPPAARAAEHTEVLEIVSIYGDELKRPRTIYFLPPGGAVLFKCEIPSSLNRAPWWKDVEGDYKGKLFAVRYEDLPKPPAIAVMPGRPMAPRLAPRLPGSLMEIKLYDGPPELVDPRVWIFKAAAKTLVKAESMPAVQLWRPEREIQATLLYRPAAGGKIAPDPGLLERFNQLKTGDPIEVDLEWKGDVATLTNVGPYHAPMVAEFVRVGQVQADKKIYPAGIFLIDGKNVTLAMPPNSLDLRPDQTALIAAFKLLKPGDMVRVSANNDPALRMLRRIEPHITQIPKTNGTLIKTPNMSFQFYLASDGVHDVNLTLTLRSHRPQNEVLNEGWDALQKDQTTDYLLKLNAQQHRELYKIMRPSNADLVTVIGRDEMEKLNGLYADYFRAIEPADCDRTAQVLRKALELVSQKAKVLCAAKYQTLRRSLTPEQIRTLTESAPKSAG